MSEQASSWSLPQIVFKIKNHELPYTEGGNAVTATELKVLIIDNNDVALLSGCLNGYDALASISRVAIAEKAAQKTQNP